MTTGFILRSDVNRYKQLLKDLKRLANLGRDEYPESLTEAFNLLVRESGEYDTVRNRYSNRYRGRGGQGGQSFFLLNKVTVVVEAKIYCTQGQMMTTVMKLLLVRTEVSFKMLCVFNVIFMDIIVTCILMPHVPPSCLCTLVVCSRRMNFLISLKVGCF